MKQNLNEQVTRIKKMMGINEQSAGYVDDDMVEPVDYELNEPIIKEIKRIDADDEIATISMVFNVRVPNGENAQLTIISKWNRNPKFVVEVIDMFSDIDIDDKTYDFIGRGLLRRRTTLTEFLDMIYRPYLVMKNVDSKQVYRNQTDNYNDLFTAIGYDSKL